MGKYLEGKRILFIGIGFYDYDKAIKEEIEKAGAKVDYFQEFFYTLKFKIFSKLSKVLVKKLENRRQNEILVNSGNDYDYIFIIKGETLTKDFLENLKVKNENAEFIMYQWDSVERVSNYRQIEGYFDKKISFDRIDTQKYKDLIFLPLFHRSVVEDKKKIEENIDISFVGWYHSDRYEVSRKISKYCSKNGFKSYFYIFTGIITYIFIKFDKFKEEEKEQEIIRKEPLEYKKFLDVVEKSRSVLDLAHPNQKGLTMRTIELLARGKKIVTNNIDIVNYDFYNSNNVYLYKGDLEADFLEFLNSEYKKIDKEIIEKYSIENWIKTIFS